MDITKKNREKYSTVYNRFNRNDKSRGLHNCMSDSGSTQVKDSSVQRLNLVNLDSTGITH